MTTSLLAAVQAPDIDYKGLVAAVRDASAARSSC